MKPGIYMAPAGTPLDGKGWVELDGYISEDGIHAAPQKGWTDWDAPAKEVQPPPPYPVQNIATQKRRKRL